MDGLQRGQSVGSQLSSGGGSVEQSYPVTRSTPGMVERSFRKTLYLFGRGAIGIEATLITATPDENVPVGLNGRVMLAGDVWSQTEAPFMDWILL
jgi:hypothetical protein